jgi:hypothetical protein
MALRSQRVCDSTSGRDPARPGNPVTNPPSFPVIRPVDPPLFEEREDAVMLEKVSPSLVREVLALVASKPMWVSLHYTLPTFGAVTSTEVTGSGYQRQRADMEIGGRMIFNSERLRFRGLDTPVTIMAAAVSDSEVGGVVWGYGRFNPPRQLIDERSAVIGRGELTFRIA